MASARPTGGLYLDAKTFSATWASAAGEQHQMYYGRFDYTAL